MGLGKIDLHLHLDGSLDLNCAYQLAKERKVIKEDMSFEEFSSKMSVPEDNPSLEECLKCFDFPLAILQDSEALEKSTYALIKNLHQLEVMYAEIRFAPQLHKQKGMSQAEAVEAVIAGRNRALKEFKGIHVNLILCMMTIGPAALNENENRETVEVAKQYLNQGVVALDLAGNEGACPILDFKPLFDRAQELGVPYTIHAGEAGPASNVKDAIAMGAWRIGHGGHCTQDPEVKKQVIDKQIPLEICITSNIQCCCQPSYAEHAIVELFKEGACVTINTDNMTLSKVTLASEIEQGLIEMGFTEEDILTMIKNSIRAAFISEEEKAALLARLDNGIS